MSTSQTPAVPATLEQKIDQAASEAATVAATFSPALGVAIQSGVAVEPVISGFIHMLIGLFKHHAKAAAAPAPAPITTSVKPGTLADAIAKAKAGA